MAKETLDRAEAVIKTLDDVVTRDELADFLEKILKRLDEREARLDRALQMMETATKSINYETIQGNLLSVNEAAHSFSRDKLQKHIDDFKSEYSMELGMLKGTTDEHRTTATKHRDELVKALARLSKLEDGHNNLPIKDLLTRLTSFSAALDALEKRLKSLETKPTSGGVTNLRIQQAFKYILKTEQPVGDIDGVNTTYTVTQPIFAILAFSLNGETIAQLPNYTISGRTITFSSALPAAYSGKDFEIKFV
jgi:exonuclease VII small subunit/ribosome-associated translation inhibitor RaiA